MRFYLIRHPVPLIERGICYGRSEVSVQQEIVDNTTSLLWPFLPVCLPVYSSPASRCIGLAGQLAERLKSGIPVHDSRLAEMDFGAWEMCSWNDIPRREIDDWAENLLFYRPGDGETVMEMAYRVVGFYNDVSKMQKDIIVVCHAGTIRLLQACQAGGTIEDIALRAAKTAHKIDYASLTIVED